MNSTNRPVLSIVIVVSPHFNVSATTSFIDPFRAANYLSGSTRFSWRYTSEKGGIVESSSGLAVLTEPLEALDDRAPWLALVSTSWTPEVFLSPPLRRRLRTWSHQGTLLGGLDTGAIVLANAGLLNNKSATVHYEHIDAFIELAPDTHVSENTCVFEDRVFSCSGGSAATDAGLRLVRSVAGESMSNAAARYLFHHDIRGDDVSQNPKHLEPMGYTAPNIVKRAIDLMEQNLENPVSIPHIAETLGISQRQLGRVFRASVHKTPVEYYRDIRLDRARGLVTQTEMTFSEVAAASGFNSQVHFSRSYTQRFGLPPSSDRVQGRVPFEFRAWPMFKPDIKSVET